MHAFTFILAVLFAALALSSPLDKRGRRGIFTEIDIVTVTEYTTIGAFPTRGPNHHFEQPAASSPPPAPVSSSTSEYVASPPASTPAATSTTSTTSTSSSTVEPVAASSEAAPPPASSSSSVAAAPSPVLSGGSDFQSMVLDSHNVHRANHSCDPLTWDDELASIAADIASSCVYGHNVDAGGGFYGQNIGAGIEQDHVAWMITNMMYNDEMMKYPGYGDDNPDMTDFEAWGHFSQIVWADTTTVGCAVQYCSSLANVGPDVPPIFTVCNYRPAGNMGGQYTNVHPPLGQPIVFAE